MAPGSTLRRPSVVEQLQLPRSLRAAQVAAAVLYCLFSSGIIFGYAALKPVLISEGVYRHLCTADELASQVPVCHLQELRLNLMFNVAAVTTNTAALPVGAILDRYGPRITSLLGCLLLLCGTSLLALAPMFPPEKIDAFIPSYILLALAGPLIFISSFQLSNAFPANSGLVLSCLTGAFDSSSAIWLGYRILYEATAGDDGKRGVSLSTFFGVYSSVPVIIAILQLTLMPKASYKSMSELVKDAEDEPLDDEEDVRGEEAVENDETDDLARNATSSLPDEDGEDHTPELRFSESTERTALLSVKRHSSAGVVTRMRRRSSAVTQISAIIGEEATESAHKRELKKRNISGVWGAQHGKTALQQIRSWWFVLAVLFTMVQMLRTNYFIATIRPQYEYLLRSWPLAVRLNGFFDLALPLGGLVSIPFIGLLLDYTSTVFTLSVLVIMSALIGGLGIVPNSPPAGYANVVLFVLYRPLFYTAVSDYAAKVFGFRTFGTVYGLIICIAGLFNLAQSGLDSLTVRTNRGNPIPVNIGLLVAGFLTGSALVIYVASTVRRLRKEEARDLLEAEAQQAEERIMPDPALTYR